MPHIIAYTYEGDVYCPDCTKARWGRQGFRLDTVEHMRLANNFQRVTDEHHLPINLIDREGNPVHPVFSTDEREFTRCSDCGESL